MAGEPSAPDTGPGEFPDPVETPSGITRKSLLKAAAIAIPAPLILGAAAPALAGTFSTDADGNLAATPQCDDGDETHDAIEGPYFKPNSPLRSDLTAGLPGTPMTLSGFVYGINCQPVAAALLDFWQADDNGDYDMQGFTLRGHQFSNSDGSFSLKTIVPGLYPGRTRHFHVKVQAPNQPILTTQLYFPGEPRNSTDSLYDPALLMDVQSGGGGRLGTFNFVLNVMGTPPTSAPPTGGPTSSPTRSPSPSPTGGGGGGTSWTPWTSYNTGDVVTYNGRSYRCVQGHTALPGWDPPLVPALWQPI